MKFWRCLFLLLALGIAPRALAHDSLPLVLSVAEKARGLYLVRASLPPAIAMRGPPVVHMPKGCEETAPQSSVYRCRANPGGQRLSWTFAGSTPATPTLVRIEWLSGEVRTELAPPGVLHVGIPQPESAESVSGEYLEMGVRHILTGYDHLLFLACLLWIAGSFRRILVTITGFTLAHSLTLGLSALNVIHVPIPPTEAGIALSILFLAREIALGARNSLVWRHPAVVSSLFGLLHGLGFASALREVGLPQTQLLAGLFFFNVGVEIGQLMTVILAVGVLMIGRRMLAGLLVGRSALRVQATRRAEQMALICIGTLSTFWFIERVSLF